MKSQLTFVHALSPLHAGIGQGAGTIDLPIAREKATGIPFLPGSSIKGALRTSASEDQKKIFGSDPGETEQVRSSSVLFSDQRLLLLPVRSIAGTFAWVTSPYVLHRFMRDLAEVQVKSPTKQIPEIEDAGQCRVTGQSKLKPTKENMVYLEDFDLKITDGPNGQLDEWAGWLSAQIFPGEEPEDTSWQRMFVERLCLVHDDLFHFMCQYATEITARIQLEDDTKTVTDGGLWYEEALPAETILSGVAAIAPVSGIKISTGQKDEKISEESITTILKELAGHTLQLGGKATVGRGMCRIQLV
jgi:CRISPR-associated protein Cmr4